MKIALVVAVVGLTACAGSVGNVKLEDPAVVAQVRAGATQDQVRALLGAPDHRTPSLGGEVWEYVYVRTAANGAAFVPVVGLFAAKVNQRSRTLAVAFDAQGVAQKVIEDQHAAHYGALGQKIDGPGE